MKPPSCHAKICMMQAFCLYRRLLQMGHPQTPGRWCNLGLCSFHTAQYISILPCFQRALGRADDGAAADIWCVDSHHLSIPDCSSSVPWDDECVSY